MAGGEPEEAASGDASGSGSRRRIGKGRGQKKAQRCWGTSSPLFAWPRGLHLLSLLPVGCPGLTYEPLAGLRELGGEEVSTLLWLSEETDGKEAEGTDPLDSMGLEDAYPSPSWFFDSSVG